MPGMIIPEMKVNFAGTVSMQCSAQVIYLMSPDGGGSTRCGLAVLDMDLQSYSRLTHILSNALDPHSHVSGDVDMEALWEFFFTAGFIYPKKYRLIQSRREEFKKTYEKLYLEKPEIARHFTYQRNGRIYGHISMVRAYERAWMIHHHAGEALDSKRTGFIVLKQLMNYLNDMHRLPSACMDYAMSYFRPENKFPDRVFGGFARFLGNPKGCSMDLFCYLPHTSLSLGSQLPAEYSLEESTPAHLWELNRCYNSMSGGLLLDALGLAQWTKAPTDEPLSGIYRDLGFLRSWRVFSLTREGDLMAVLVLNQSDLGFNLSELLNGIKVLVMEPDKLSWNVLSVAISTLAGQYPTDKVPVLFSPVEYVREKKIPFEKYYAMWVLNVQYGNEYMEYIHKRFRIN